MVILYVHIDLLIYTLYILISRQLYEDGGGIGVSTLQPLVKQVITEIFDPSKPELHDIYYKPTGFRDMIKSGFGY